MFTVGSAQRMDTLLGHIQRTQQKLEKAEYQVATGTKGPLFSDYGKVSGVVSVQTAIRAREAFMTNAESANVTLTLVNNVLDQVGDIASEADEFAQNNSYNYVAAQDLKNTAYAWMQTIISDMNLEGPEGYLFGGLDGDGLPVVYATELDDASWTKLTGDPDDVLFDPTTEGAFWFLNKDAIRTNAGELPIKYDGSWPATLSPSAPYQDSYYQGGRLYDTDGNIDAGLKTRVDRDQTVPTGFSAAEEGIEKLLYGLHMLVLAPVPDENPAPGDPTFAEQQAFYQKAVNAAREIILESVNEITSINIRAASSQITVEGAIERHTQTLALEKNLLGDLTKVDQAEAIVKYQSLQTNLEATYSVTARVSELSLVNYL